MSSELIHYMNGSAKIERRDRSVARQAKRIHDEVRLQAFKADGALALGGHIMEGVVDLDSRRRDLAGDDPVLSGLLADIEGQALRAVKKIQANLYEDWGL